MPRKVARRRVRYDHGEPIRGIDIRPVVFVALFVAILFLIPASQTRTHALLVTLPPPPNEEAVIEGAPRVVHRIRVTAADEVQFDGELVNDRQLEALLNWVSTDDPSSVLAFEPDGAASYNRSGQVLAVILRAGLIGPMFCIDGLEKHRQWEKQGVAFPILLSIHLDPAKGAQSMLPPSGFESCAPELLTYDGPIH